LTQPATSETLARVSPLNTEAAEALGRARATLRQAELALAELSSPDLERRLAGLRNVIVWTRAVTPIVQQLRSRVDGFEEWYGPWRSEMEDDPMLKYLYDLRNVVLKEGGLPPISSALHIARLSSADLPPAPPGARSFFIGDPLGGIGWEVDLPDGTTGKVYVALPTEMAQSWHGFADIPATHLGQPLIDRSLENVCRLYVEYLDRLIASAASTFANG
jgi:hypothetical protein